ncbi:MAG: hypothetical protein AAFW98_13495, partial [Pseudomonadota bacterium]
WSLSLSAPDGRITLHATDETGNALGFDPVVTVADPVTGRDVQTVALVAGDVVQSAETLPPGLWALHATVGDGEDALAIRSVVDVAQ